jgi:hypothetical protein
MCWSIIRSVIKWPSRFYEEIDERRSWSRSRQSIKPQLRLSYSSIVEVIGNAPMVGSSIRSEWRTLDE